MTINHQFIGLYTIIRRELTRMIRISTQVFLPPVITTFLYFLIFGTIIGNRMGPIAGMSYQEFIAPGLIMMAVITNAYANVSTSLFSVRFQKSIEEMLISPLYNSFILLGFVFGGILRGLIVGILVFIVSCFFVPFSLHNIIMTLIVIILVAAVFSLAGFINGMVARNFDDVALIPTFILTPLTYLGGVFYSIKMLSPFWQNAIHFDPIFYMVNALRHTMIGQEEVGMNLAMGIILFFLGILIYLNLWMLKRGTGLRE